MNELIDSKQLAKYLGVSVRTLDTLYKKGDLPPSLCIGRLRRWRIEDVEQWVNERLGKHTTKTSDDITDCAKLRSLDLSELVSKE